MKNVFYAASVFCLCTAMISCNNTNKKTETVRTADGETQVVTTTTSTTTPRNQTNTQMATPELLEGEWNVIELNGYPVQTGQENSPYMGFNLPERRVYGYSGCNMMTGELMIDSTRNGVIAFDKMAMTRKACPNDTMETPFVNAVNGIKSYRVVDCNDNNNDNCKIALLDGNNNQVIMLQKRTDLNNNNNSSNQQ